MKGPFEATIKFLEDKNMMIYIPHCKTDIIFSTIKEREVSYMFCKENLHVSRFSADPTEFIRKINIMLYISKITVETVNDSENCIDITIYEEDTSYGIIRITSENPQLPVYKCININRINNKDFNNPIEIWTDIKRYPYGILNSFKIYYNEIILNTCNCCINFESEKNQENDLITIISKKKLDKYIGCRIIKFEVSNNFGVIYFDYGKFYFSIQDRNSSATIYYTIDYF